MGQSSAAGSSASASCRGVHSERASSPAKIDATTTFDANDFRNAAPRFTPEARAANLALVDLLKRAAEQKHATPAQLALAWLLAQKPVTQESAVMPRASP